jgi:hypothetical protein
MKYGAYRRWKLAEGLENLDSRGRPRKTSGRGAAKGSSPGSGYRPGDYKIDGQGGVGGKAVGGDNKSKSNSKNKKKNKGGSTTDAFYKAIREMGSRPVSGDSVSGTGVAEPKGDKNPITPKKAP